METKIFKGMEGLDSNDKINARPDVFVNDEASASANLICGKLQYLQQDGEDTVYQEVAAGCIWVYLTDDNGNIEAGSQHQCQAGNQLRVTGPHAFGCSC